MGEDKEEFNLYDIAEPSTSLVHDNSDNGGPPLDDRMPEFVEIDDLYDEARHWADGEPITSSEMAEAITALRDGLHEAGKRAEEKRVSEKAPLDKLVAEIQGKFNPYIQAKKGKVDLGKSALGKLLTDWRVEQQKIAAAKAEKARLEAEEEKRLADAAMQASAGNLAAREEAEKLLSNAKQAEKFAKRTEKSATTGTGLRTEWIAEMLDVGAGLDWAYARSPERFTELTQQIADEAVRAGAREIAGFKVSDKKVAR